MAPDTVRIVYEMQPVLLVRLPVDLVLLDAAAARAISADADRLCIWWQSALDLGAIANGGLILDAGPFRC